MATYIISYDLSKPGRDYSGLYDAIKSLATTYWHHLESTWLIDTVHSAAQIRDALKQSVDSNDKLLVLRSGREAAWCGFNANGSQWLKENL